MVPGARVENQFDYPSTINLLNNHGIYELPDVSGVDSIRLLINNTEGINGTRIKCVAIGATTISITNLIISG